MQLEITNSELNFIHEAVRELNTVHHVLKDTVNGKIEEVLLECEFSIKISDMKRYIATKFPNGCEGISCDSCDLATKGCTGCAFNDFLHFLK